MGHTTANDVAFSYPLFADDVIGLLDALGVRKANVLGFSMGSTITQELLAEHSQRLDKAIICATSTDGSHVAAVLRGQTSDDPTTMRQVEATTHWKTPLDKLSLIANPVMLLVGTPDRVVGIESSKMLASAIPGAWLVQFKNGTHAVMGEAPAEFVKIVLAFLDIDPTVEIK